MAHSKTADLGAVERENIEQEIGRTLTDDEWSDFRNELVGRVDNFVNALVEDLILDLELSDEEGDE